MSLMTGAASEDLVRFPRSILVLFRPDLLDVGLGVGHRVDVDLGKADRGHVVHGEGGRVHGVLQAATAARGAEAAHSPPAHVAAQLQRPGRAVILLDRVLERGLGGHHRLDVVARHELDVVHGEHVGRVGHGDGQGRPGPAQGKDLVLAGRFGRDDLDDRGIHLEVVQVDRGDAVLPGEEARDLLVLDIAQGDEGLPKLSPVHLLVAERFLELLRSHHVLLEQQFAELDGHSVYLRNLREKPWFI